MKLLLIVLILLAGCVTTQLSIEGRGVRQAYSFKDVKDCTLIKTVVGSDRLNGGANGQGIAKNNAIREIKNKSAKFKANTFLIVDESTGMFGSVIMADSFKCYE